MGNEKLDKLIGEKTEKKLEKGEATLSEIQKVLAELLENK